MRRRPLMSRPAQAAESEVPPALLSGLANVYAPHVLTMLDLIREAT